jgi:acyl dehydratase
MRILALLHGDGNPIHLDPDVAVAQGLGDRVVNPGGANLGYVLNALAELIPEGRLERVRVDFRANVFADDDVVAVAGISEESPREPGQLRCEVYLEVQGGGRALEGTATLKVDSNRLPPHRSGASDPERHES